MQAFSQPLNVAASKQDSHDMAPMAAPFKPSALSLNDIYTGRTGPATQQSQLVFANNYSPDSDRDCKFAVTSQFSDQASSPSTANTSDASDNSEPSSPTRVTEAAYESAKPAMAPFANPFKPSSTVFVPTTTFAPPSFVPSAPSFQPAAI